MDSTDWKSSSGQTIVQVAMLMVVFIALMSIAIDMGYIFNERRRMQNAADAAALAGAWELCLGEPAQAAQTAWEYAVDRNGAQAADVSVGNLRVTVFARETVDLNVAQFFGISTAEINARAVAACGAAESGCNMWPVTFPVWKWTELTGGFGANCVAGKVFYIWTGQQENQSPDCEIYDCDVDGDGSDDVVDIWGRAFLDFGDTPDPNYPDDCRSTGCGEDELACWIANESGGYVQIPDCIAGTTGVKAATKIDVTTRIGDIVGIPIYESQGCIDDDMEICPGGETYYVNWIGCVYDEGWVHGLELPRLDGANPPWKDKAIKVTVSCEGCTTACGNTHGEVPEPWEMTAVSLIE
jgi:Flp pilus assembly protein TadG